jgi:hypothetical protein
MFVAVITRDGGPAVIVPGMIRDRVAVVVMPTVLTFWAGDIVAVIPAGDIVAVIPAGGVVVEVSRLPRYVRMRRRQIVAVIDPGASRVVVAGSMCGIVTARMMTLTLAVIVCVAGVAVIVPRRTRAGRECDLHRSSTDATVDRCCRAARSEHPHR